MAIFRPGKPSLILALLANYPQPGTGAQTVVFNRVTSSEGDLLLLPTGQVSVQTPGLYIAQFSVRASGLTIGNIFQGNLRMATVPTAVARVGTALTDQSLSGAGARQLLAGDLVDVQLTADGGTVLSSSTRLQVVRIGPVRYTS